MVGAISGLDLLILVGLPYAAAAAVAIGCVGLYRGSLTGFFVRPTRFAESPQHFWMLAPLRYGFLVVLLIHGTAFLAPGLMLAWDSFPLGLYAIEVLVVSGGFIALTGAIVGFTRRLLPSLLQSSSGLGEWIVLGLITTQAATGLLAVFSCRWGTAWFAAAGTPYLRSLLLLNPDIGSVVGAPWPIKLHLVNAFLLLGLLPYSRLLHVLMAPLTDLIRAQVVARWIGWHGRSSV